MSFQSGFNSGLNHFASMRADASRQRELEFAQGQAQIDNARTARLDEDNLLSSEVDRRLREGQIKAIEQEMRLEKKLQARLFSDQAEARTALGLFSEGTRGLNLMDPDDQKKWREAYNSFVPSIGKDPEARRTFDTLVEGQMLGGAGDLLKVGQARQVERLVRLQQHSERLLERGVDITDMDDPRLSSSMAYERLSELGSKNGVWIGDAINELGLADKGEFGLEPNDIHRIESWMRERGIELGNMSDSQKQTEFGRNDVQDAFKRGDIVGAIEATGRGGKDLSDTQLQQFRDIGQVADQMLDVKRAMENMKTPTGAFLGPILSEAMRLTQQDQEVALFDASVTSLIPSLARKVFGEVGVLTDQDIDNYKKVVASAGQTKEANQIVMAATGALVNRAITRGIETMARQNVNVSGFADTYKKASNRPVSFYPDVKTAQAQIDEDLASGRLKPSDIVSVWSGRSVVNIPAVDPQDNAANTN